MKTLNTEDVIKNIEDSGYTDIIFDFDQTIAHLIIDWSYFHEYMKVLAEKYRLEQERTLMNTHEFCELLIEKYGDTGKKEIDKIFEMVESEHLKDIVINHDLVKFIKENSHKYYFHILSNNVFATLNSALKKLKIEECFDIVL